MGIAHYREQFTQKLGFVPYRGTLNIRLSARSAKLFDQIKEKEGVLIKGSGRGKKALEMARCYRAELRGIKCALVIPKMSRHIGVAEIISTERLRSALKLKDGSRIRVSVEVR